ncbi:MAG: alanine--tRNA ligase [Candidatus Krumholzibacteria bacterium]|nr:alanine--tRNA ligase [Candidatus Krumholzibacteria bacterium]
MNADIRTANEIRRAYVDFFLAKGHTEVPSAPLVPKNDPTLLFTSAGMVQFKDFYLQPENLPYTRAVGVQKCLRAGDLENIGKTLRHHTLFEMLGNFSFGDYFKKEAIAWAWEFVMDVLQLPEDKLYVSIYQDDDEAFEIWNGDVGVSAERIVRLGKKDNFWGPVGATGVCGPCSEIYYDAGEEKGCGEPGCAPGCDCDRYLEFWNLVFPQYFLEENGEYRPLDKPGIDTGAGLERIAMIMQGVEDNFHTDVFSPIIEAVIAGLPEGTNIGHAERMDINMIADHIRALTFTLSEGIYPSNEGRGYLLRRILRRALTRLHLFGIDSPFLTGLVSVVAGVMSDSYPELERRRADVERIIRSEEESFFRTLEDGKSRFESIVTAVRDEGGSVIDGKKAFILYDTFGFPLELTTALAGKEGFSVDEKGFEEAMKLQRKRAQENSSFSAGGTGIVSMNSVTEGESSVFDGYDGLTGEGVLRSYRVVDRDERKDVNWADRSGSALELVFDKTPFYATSGGQMADRGKVTISGDQMIVRDVFKRGGDVVHLVEPGDTSSDLEALASGSERALLEVDGEWRLATACNHTATHLLHAALRQVVGEHVAQAGSSVDGERLRFDFNHFQAVRSEEKRQIEDLVNGWVRDLLPVKTELMDYQAAVKSGAIAIFDEKYGAKVRVVSTGDVSTELCGGTHLDNSGRIGFFVIIAEGSVAAGVRRIEAMTGPAALEFVYGRMDDEEKTAGLLGARPAELPSRITSLLGEIENMKKAIKELEKGEAGGGFDAILKKAVDVGGVKVVAGRIPVQDPGRLRAQADVFRERVDSGVAVFSAPSKDKMHYVVAVTDDLIKNGIQADLLVKELGAIAGGGGGGKKHLAQLGTKDLESEKKVFDALPDILGRLLSERG